MEDAVKALIITGGVMIAIMVISLGIALGTSLSKYTDNAQQLIEENAVQSFNEQFFKYINCQNSATSAQLDFTLTIHDVITAANIAYEYNHKYNLNSSSNYNYYVVIKMRNRRITRNYRN